MAEEWAKGWIRKNTDLNAGIPDELRVRGEIRKSEHRRGEDALKAREEQLKRAIKALEDEDSEFVIMGYSKVDPETGEKADSGRFAWLIEFYTDSKNFLPLLIQSLKGMGADIRKYKGKE